MCGIDLCLFVAVLSFFFIMCGYALTHLLKFIWWEKYSYAFFISFVCITVAAFMAIAAALAFYLDKLYPTGKSYIYLLYFSALIGAGFRLYKRKHPSLKQ